MRRFSIWFLELAERLFLRMHDWHKMDGYYYPPDGYPASRSGTKKYHRSHAVNSQKQFVYNEMHGGTRVDPDLRKEKGYETL